MEKENVIISEGEKPIWQLILAALFYTISLFSVAYYFYLTDFSFDREYVKGSLGLLKLAFIIFIAGLSLSVKNSKLFALAEKKYKDEFSVGPIKVGKWKPLPKLDYVSVFKNTNEIFEINIWHSRNKHFNIYSYEDKKEALENGYNIAVKLNLKLLDATIPNKNKFLDMDELSKEYK